MYFREKVKPIEHYDGTVDKTSGKFPMWLLVAIIAVVIIIALFFIFRLRSNKSGQKFGFRFY
jgi:uncharacterized membrane protein